MRDNVDSKRRMLNYIGVDVPKDGQNLMNTIAKTLLEARWDKSTIIVMNAVSVCPPYTLADVRMTGEESMQNKHTLQYVRNVVEKHLRDEQARQTSTQNDTRTSITPSPSSSGSSAS